MRKHLLGACLSIGVFVSDAWNMKYTFSMQITCLEESGLLEKQHSNSLSGAIDALEASTLRLPLVGGARVYSFLIL